MRTKTTLLCAAVLATGLASSMAQNSNVYSLNVVGYYNVDSPAGQKILIANQLNTTNNTIGNVLPGPWASGTAFFQYNNGFTGNPWNDDDQVWDNPNMAMPVGSGGFFFSQSHQTLTFVGEVVQGPHTNVLINNQKVIQGYSVPKGIYLSASGIIGQDGDAAFQYHNGFTASPWNNDDSIWDPDSSNAVGEAWFIFKGTGTGTNWIVNFTVQ